MRVVHALLSISVSSADCRALLTSDDVIVKSV